MKELKNENEIIKHWGEGFKAPVVSIRCLTFNHGKYIEDALEGFLMQETNFPFEILIHDDASTDNTTTILNEYEQKYPNIIKVFYQPNNTYTLKTDERVKLRKPYYDQLVGKYIADCEGDDYWIDPLKLQKQIDYMESNPVCTLCVHSVYQVNVSKKKVGSIAPYDIDTIPKPSDIIISNGLFFGTSSYLRRNMPTEEMPEFYYLCPVGDYAQHLYHLAIGEIHYLSQFMSVYRIGVPGSWTTSQTGNLIKRLRILNSRIPPMIAFNEFTNNRYSIWVDLAVSLWEIRIKQVEEIISNYNKLPKEMNLIKKWIPNYSQPLVSIIFFIESDKCEFDRSFKGFLSQETTFSFEILIVCNKESEHNLNYINYYKNRYPKIVKTVFSSIESKSSKPSSLNSYHNEAVGKYVAYCEGGDYWSDPTKLQRQVDYMNNNSSCTLCAHIAEEVNVKFKKTGNSVFKNSRGSEQPRLSVVSSDLISAISTFMVRNIDAKKCCCTEYSHYSTACLYYLESGEIHIIDRAMSLYRTQKEYNVIEPNIYPDVAADQILQIYIKDMVLFNKRTFGKYQVWVNLAVELAESKLVISNFKGTKNRSE